MSFTTDEYGAGVEMVAVVTLPEVKPRVWTGIRCGLFEGFGWTTVSPSYTILVLYSP